MFNLNTILISSGVLTLKKTSMLCLVCRCTCFRNDSAFVVRHMLDPSGVSCMLSHSRAAFNSMARPFAISFLKNFSWRFFACVSLGGRHPSFSRLFTLSPLCPFQVRSSSNCVALLLKETCKKKKEEGRIYTIILVKVCRINLKGSHERKLEECSFMYSCCFKGESIIFQCVNVTCFSMKDSFMFVSFYLGAFPPERRTRPSYIVNRLIT